MKTIKRYVLGIMIMCMVLLCVAAPVANVYADDIGGAGGTQQGNIGGTNVYTFYYIYDSVNDAIELKVVTITPLYDFGNTTEHTYKSMDDKIVLNTRGAVLGASLDSAIADMNRIGGYNLSVADAKAELGAMGYYDDGTGIWRWSGGYLTYVSAVKIRKKTHTVKYDANGGSGAPGNQTKTEGSILTLSSKKPSKDGYTFKYWVCSAGGNYNPGSQYGRDQDGGSVTMKAHWADETKPSIDTLSATPSSWSSGNGAVVVKVKDQGSGVGAITLERYSYVSSKWTTVATWDGGGSKTEVSKTYTEKEEGKFKYKVTVKDKAGNSNNKTSSDIYLDHSGPELTASVSSSSWTKTPPTISASATDYLSGTSVRGSGVKSVVIKDSSGTVVASGTTSKTYKLETKYSGTRAFTIVATDNVGHTASKRVTTKYDGDKPVINLITASPDSWSSGNGTVKIEAIDKDSGIEKIELRRVSNVNGSSKTVKTWNIGGVSSKITETYTETEEGIYTYTVWVYDVVGNFASKASNKIYIDHSNPMLTGLTKTETDWTNKAPEIDVSATDYLYGTTYNGSGIESIVIKDESGKEIKKGTSSVSYTLEDKYEGIHSFTITVKDKVGHTVSKSVTTKYDKTPPSIEGNETDFIYNGQNVSGYCQDNVLDQNIDDSPDKSPAEHTSGIKNVIMYGVKKDTKTAINGDTTLKVFTVPDEAATFHLYYDCNGTDDKYEYYLVVVRDFAGNVTQKKLVSQKALLSWFRTSIEG